MANDWFNIPCIDIGSLRQGFTNSPNHIEKKNFSQYFSNIFHDPKWRTDFDSSEANKIGREFAEAAKQFGFVTIRNHGLKKEMINAVIEQMDMFMATEVHFIFSDGS